LALGLAILSRGGSFSGYSSLLIGDILSIKASDLIALAVVLAVTVAFAFLFFNSVLAVAIHQTLASVSGIRFRLLEHGFAVLVAVVVALSIRWIGILLINAMLILPAASARSISGNLREYMGFTLIFSVFSSVIGLASSYFLSIASGPAIVLVSALIYAACYIYGRKRQ
jgi:zinc transport system permease protein